MFWDCMPRLLSALGLYISSKIPPVQSRGLKMALVDNLCCIPLVDKCGSLPIPQVEWPHVISGVKLRIQITSKRLHLSLEE